MYVFCVDAAGKIPSTSPAAAALRTMLATTRPLVVHHAQAVVRWLTRAGVNLDISRLDILDARVLAWLAAPDDAHEGGIHKTAAFFPLFPTQGTAARAAGGPTAGPAGAAVGGGPMSRSALELFRGDLLTSAWLVKRLRRERLSSIPRVVRTEGQLAAVLGQLEALGVGFDAAHVRRGVAALRTHLEDLEARAAGLLGDGNPINLASPQQVADVLYNRLGLPTPSSNAMAGAKTGQLTTKDEHLQKLVAAGTHGLPALVLEHRATLRAIAMCTSYTALAVSAADNGNGGGGGSDGSGGGRP